MKQAGLDDDSEWLEDHVVANLNRGFVIRRVEDAKAREAPKMKKKVPAKRKVKLEPTGEKESKKKKKKRVEAQEEEEKMDEDGSMVDDADENSPIMETVDAESDDESAIDLDRLTAEMMGEKDDDEEEDDDDDEDDEEEENDEDDEEEDDGEEEEDSEEEAEFD